MDSYSIASVFRSARHDSFHRKLADDLARHEAKPGSIEATGNVRGSAKESADNWMRHDLARVKRHGP